MSPLLLYCGVVELSCREVELNCREVKVNRGMSLLISWLPVILQANGYLLTESIDKSWTKWAPSRELYVENNSIISCRSSRAENKNLLWMYDAACYSLPSFIDSPHTNTSSGWILLSNCCVCDDSSTLVLSWVRKNLLCVLPFVPSTSVVDPDPVDPQSIGLRRSGSLLFFKDLKKLWRKDIFDNICFSKLSGSGRIRKKLASRIRYSEFGSERY